MKKVLQVVSILDRGGEETMLMNYYRNIDRNKLQFDFLVHYDKRGVYEDEIEKLGGKIYRAFPIRPWNYGAYKKCLRQFFSEHKDEYVAVHAHILENCGFVLEAAYEAGIPIRAAHSHLAAPVFDIKLPFRKYGKYVLRKSHVTKKFACGKEAGEYLYDGDDFMVLPNAIETSKFVYNPVVRNEVRKELGIGDDEIVIGDVARFHPVKNQTFLVDIFQKLRQIKTKSKMLLVGVGQEQEKVRKKVNDMGLADSVLFLNVRTDVNRLLQAMDAFVAPSKVEGLPVSLIEAQASGIACILSDRVSKETAITDLVQFVALDETPETWAEIILESVKINRRDVTEQIKKAHYDIEENANWLQKFYLGEVQ